MDGDREMVSRLLLVAMPAENALVGAAHGGVNTSRLERAQGVRFRLKCSFFNDLDAIVAGFAVTGVQSRSELVMPRGRQSAASLSVVPLVPGQGRSACTSSAPQYEHTILTFSRMSMPPVHERVLLVTVLTLEEPHVSEERGSSFTSFPQASRGSSCLWDSPKCRRCPTACDTPRSRPS
jgi:hypothetical protein